MSMQIFPAESLVHFKGVEIVEPDMLALLPEAWRNAARVLIQMDGRAFVGMPAVLAPTSALGTLETIAALPRIAAAIAARQSEIERGLEDDEAENLAALKADVHPASVIAKRAESVYYAPYMTGYADVRYDPDDGDKIFSRGVDAEAAGFDPAVGPPPARTPDEQSARDAMVRAGKVKAECRRRILLVTKDTHTQLNIAAHVQDIIERKVSGEEITAENQSDIEMARAIKEWVVDMQTRCRDHCDDDSDYLSDAAWPPAPDGAAEFCDFF